MKIHISFQIQITSTLLPDMTETTLVQLQTHAEVILHHRSKYSFTKLLVFLSMEELFQIALRAFAMGEALCLQNKCRSKSDGQFSLATNGISMEQLFLVKHSIPIVRHNPVII